jgi:hypothetical protein
MPFTRLNAPLATSSRSHHATHDSEKPQTRRARPLRRSARIVHLLRNSFRYASRKDWSQSAKDLKPVYTAPSEAVAVNRFAEFAGKWDKLGQK